jgi:hypothetical protein
MLGDNLGVVKVKRTASSTAQEMPCLSSAGVEHVHVGDEMLFVVGGEDGPWRRHDRLLTLIALSTII